MYETSDIAALWGVHENTVLNLIRKNELAAIKVGNKWRIPFNAYNEYMAHNPTRATNEAIGIVIANQKGGVAKTTTAVNLATLLAQMPNTRVLLCDLDPQGGCSVALGKEPGDYAVTLFNVITEPRQYIIKDAIYPTDYGFSLVPSNLRLATAERNVQQLMQWEMLFKKRLTPITNEYDFVVIDTPPNLGPWTLNGMCAARYVVAPTLCEQQALKGLADLFDIVEEISAPDGSNPGLVISGILPTRYMRNKDSAATLANLTGFAKEHAIPMFGAIPNTVRITEGATYGQPAVVLNPAETKMYRVFAQELTDGIKAAARSLTTGLDRKARVG